MLWYFTTLDEIGGDCLVETLEITLSLLWCLDVQKWNSIRDRQLKCISSFGDTSYKSSRIQPKILLILYITYFSNYNFSQLFGTSFRIILKVIFVTNVSFFDGFTQLPIPPLRKLPMLPTKIFRKEIKFLWSC